jgi:hypothetical protein
MNTAVSIDLDNLEQLPAKTLLRLVETNQKSKKHLAAFQVTLNHFTPLFRQFEEWELEPVFDVNAGSIDLTFSGDGERFGKVWTELRRNGYKPYSRPKKGDTSYYGSFDQEGFARIWLNFSSTMCQRVQVGTKMVEQPVYETRCGEGLPELEADPVAVLPAPPSVPLAAD